MAEYATPGVYVEETSFRGKSIAAVSTSVAGIVGPTNTGPIRGKPEPVTSYPEFVRRYGGAEPLTFGSGDGAEDVPNYTALAARAFFDNGGKQLFVSRVINPADPSNQNPTPGFSSLAQSGLTITSRFPGSGGNLWLEFVQRDGSNVGMAPLEDANPPADGESAVIIVQGVVEADLRRTQANNPPISSAAGRFPLAIRAVVTANGPDYIIDQLLAATDTTGAEVTQADLTPGTGSAGLVIARLTAAAEGQQVSLPRFRATTADGQPVPDGTAGTLHVPEGVDVATIVTGASADATRHLPGVFTNDGDTFTVDGGVAEVGVQGNNPERDVSVSLIGASQELGWLLETIVFDVDVRTGSANGEVRYTYGNVTLNLNAGDPGRLTSAMTASPQRKEARDTSPVAVAFAPAQGLNPVQAHIALRNALFGLFDPEFSQPPAGSFRRPRNIIQLGGGREAPDNGASIDASDGEPLTPEQYRGAADIVNGSTGFAALEEIEDISMVMTPAAAAYGADNHFGVIQVMTQHCQRMRYRVGIVDAREGMSIGEVRDFRARIGHDSRLALYYPWVEINDPNARDGRPMNVPPGGFMAGIYARTDVDRGVHKTPANIRVNGALRFAQDVNRFQQELLNPLGINCLRFIDRRGQVVWGGRTLSTDVEWQYLAVRRYFLFLERSIDTSTTWAVFEPNGPKLWDNIRSAIEDFLYNEWFNGRLLGRTPEQAYFVRCDESTMTQNDLDNGRMVALVGVTPLRPAEFVVIRIGQKTADA